MNDRTPEQINSSLDRTEQILSDLTLRLDRLEVNVESNTGHIRDLSASLDRTNATIDRLADQLTSTNAAIDRLSGVILRYIDQSSIESNYQRQRLTELTDRVSNLESGEPNA